MTRAPLLAGHALARAHGWGGRMGRSGACVSVLAGDGQNTHASPPVSLRTRPLPLTHALALCGVAPRRHAHICRATHKCGAAKTRRRHAWQVAWDDLQAFEALLRNDASDKRARQKALRRALEPLWRVGGRRAEGMAM